MIDLFLQNFMNRALLGAVGIALLLGPLGCFIVWQRMAYFGATLSHSAILGIVLGLITGMNSNISVILVSMLMAVFLVSLQQYILRKALLAMDTLLGIVAHFTLALGLVLLVLLPIPVMNLEAYLFGDILAINRLDLAILWLGIIVILPLLYWIWPPLLRITIHPEIALVEGVPVKRISWIFTLLLALTIALAIQLVGVLLTISLLIIPAAAARYLSRTPEQMAIFAMLIAIGSSLLGLFLSLQWDWPAGPAMVLTATLLLIISQLIGWIRNNQ